jgi:cell wall-associated NlpC family hydrolase
VSAGNATTRTLKKGAKEAGNSIKTAEQATRTAVKTGQQAAQSAQAATKSAQKTMQAARVAAQKAAKAAKRTAQATVKAVRAIIAGAKALISAIIAGGWIALVIVLLVILLGCAVSIFGGGSRSETYTPVSAEVEAYDPMIRKYAQQYGIPEYVELIKAVMMQESGGRGLDPMQAAEGAFNTRYPHAPNGITDPEYSVQCGVQELKAALEAAGVENPVNMERIRLALQGYNFGSSYISWALKNYGGYSVANAAEFSDMQAAKLGWSSYGDKQYAAHVLRYYPYGRVFSIGYGNQAIVKQALSQLGQQGGQPYWSWYGFNGRVEWCACFVSWCANECGYIKAGIIPKFSLCSDGADWFKAQGQWQDRHYEPMAGDIIFFDWGADGTIDHVGIVEYYENGVVHTVEGNSGDACRQREYTVGSSNIYGYGLPAY